MAKKKQEIIIDNRELTPTVLAVKEDKKRSNIFSIVWIAIIFVIFIIGVYYLPEISEYVNNYLNPDDTPVYIPSEEDDTDASDDDEEEDQVIKYNITDDLEISNDVFTLNTFSLTDGSLSFSIKNNTNSLIDLSDYDYFLELYSDNDVLVERIMLTNLSISPSSNTLVTYEVDSTSTSIMLVEITTEEYEDYEVSTDISNNGTLVCTKNYETINYLVNNNKLYAIQDIYNVSITDSEYTTYYSSFQSLYTTYNMLTGVTSTLTLDNGYLVFTTVINLSTFSDSSININNILYEKDTDAKIMKFELEAQGYTCN